MPFLVMPTLICVLVKMILIVFVKYYGQLFWNCILNCIFLIQKMTFQLPVTENLSPTRYSFLFWKTVFFNCRCHAVFIVFYFIGIGSLLPWNFFITANKVCIFMTRYFLWLSRSNKVSLGFFFSVFPVQTKEYHSSLGWWLH